MSCCVSVSFQAAMMCIVCTDVVSISNKTDTDLGSRKDFIAIGHVLLVQYTVDNIPNTFHCSTLYAAFTASFGTFCLITVIFPHTVMLLLL